MTKKHIKCLLEISDNKRGSQGENRTEKHGCRSDIFSMIKP